MAQSGFLVIADITGYTAYLSSSELDHAEDTLDHRRDHRLRHYDTLHVDTVSD